MVKKSEFIWNAVASMIASMLSFVLLFVVTRVNGLTIAGAFSFAFAVATNLNAISDYGLRVYQVTDTKREYSFSTYLSTRIIVSIMMVLVTFVVIFVGGYSWQKGVLCILLVGYRFADAISETFQGEFQLNSRLDIAGKSVCIRTVTAIIVFIIVELITKDVILSSVMMMLTNFIMFSFYDMKNIKNFAKVKISLEKKIIKTILIDCFPVFFSTFLNLYIINAPKYAINSYLPDEFQTYFNVLYMPTFTINLISIFILKPLLKMLGDMWNDNRKKELSKIVIKMSVIIAVITLFVEIVCFFVGIPILNMVFGVELDGYLLDLLVLVLSGGISAVGVMLFYTLTTMRCQREVSFAYIVASVFALFVPRFLVSEQQIRGASFSCAIINSILIFGLVIIFIVEFKKSMNKEKNVG